MWKASVIHATVRIPETLYSDPPARSFPRHLRCHGNKIAKLETKSKKKKKKPFSMKIKSNRSDGKHSSWVPDSLSAARRSSYCL